MIYYQIVLSIQHCLTRGATGIYERVLYNQFIALNCFGGKLSSILPAFISSWSSLQLDFSSQNMRILDTLIPPYNFGVFTGEFVQFVFNTRRFHDHVETGTKDLRSGKKPGRLWFHPSPCSSTPVEETDRSEGDSADHKFLDAAWNLDPKWPQSTLVSRFIQLKNITKPTKKQTVWYT